jgi:hypothetical protein
VLSSVLYQEGSPLKIESVQSVLEAKRLNTYYSVRNTGLKPIKYYRIAHWFSDNTGYVLPGAMPSTDVLGPNATFSIRSKKIQALAVPASTNSYKIIGFSMIVEVGFVDGTSLSFENDFKELEAHLRLFESVYDRDLTDKRAAHR